MTCKLCNVETKGSIGPATGYLRPICPDCAEQEDGAVFASAMAQARQMDAILDLLVPIELSTEAIQ